MVVVAEAHDIVAAQIWVDELKDAGIEARVFEQGPGAALGGAVTTGWAVYPVIVEEDAFGEARSVIGRLAGMDVLRPLPDTEAEDARRLWALAAVATIAIGAMVLALVVQLVTR